MSGESEAAETIRVGDVSVGPPEGTAGAPGAAVDLPVVELLTGRAFVTGKSGSGKSNSVSVIIEQLLDQSFPVLVVDADGEYYGLKEEYEILHAGADEECDIVVSPEHAEKLATLALERNVPIILDVSGYLEESTAKELLLETTRHLFAKEKKLKKPFLMVVEECHEYIPEGGGLDETGRMLIKVGKRGRKHGLGIVGISQRPADVKKDFITQCDWLLWHRLTWDNDTSVVGRILGSSYANAVEDLNDGEGFLMCDWAESVRRVQFRRKETFDAGATPGLEDVDRPELKSVSGDLVSDLESISEAERRRESELADLRQELDRKRQRIEELERELEEARDLSAMADRFARALTRRTGGGEGRDQTDPAAPSGSETADEDTPETADTDEGSNAAGDGPELERKGERERTPEPDPDPDPSTVGAPEREFGEGLGDADATPIPVEDSPAERVGRVWEGSVPIDWAGGIRSSSQGGAGDADRADRGSETGPARERVTREDVRRSGLDRGAGAGSHNTNADADVDVDAEVDSRRAVVEELRSRIEGLPDLSVGMLRHYRRAGPADPVAAHVEAGGDGDRAHAYARNRPLRTAGLVSHAGRDRYAYAVPDLVRETCGDRLSAAELDRTVAAIETAFVPPGDRDSAGDAVSGSGWSDTDSGTSKHSRDSEITDRNAQQAGSEAGASDESDGLSEAALRLSGTTGGNRGGGPGGSDGG